MTCVRVAYFVLHLCILRFPFFFLLVPVDAALQLKQVHVITRHGSRTVLEKTGSQQRVERTVGSLTRLGEKQLYNVGVWLRRRYVGPDKLLGTSYVASEVHFESSDIERAISSANALSLGLLPPLYRNLNGSMLPDSLYQSIPILMKGSRNDLFIRAFDKCPTFDKRLEALYETSAWKETELENMNLLTELAQMDELKDFVNEEGFIPLSEVWNAFDFFNVAKVECASASDPNDSICLIDDNLQNGTWISVSALSHQAELMRYSNTTASALLGGNLLLQIHQRMGGNTDGFSPGTPVSDLKGESKYYHYSAHYATILALFAALNINPPSDEVIPDYGAAFLIHLYEDDVTSERSISLRYKEASTKNDLKIQFPNGLCQGEVYCPLQDFTKYLSSFPFTSLEEWCQQCENDSADICLAVKVQSLEALASANEVYKTACSSPSADAGKVIGGFIGGSFLTILVLLCYKRFKNIDKRVLESDAEESPVATVD
jgi:Histidine phosphatase superfamily (branch 2)